jgi:hypothetical protein
MRKPAAVLDDFEQRGTEDILFWISKPRQDLVTCNVPSADSDARSVITDYSYRVRLCYEILVNSPLIHPRPGWESAVMAGPVSIDNPCIHTGYIG